ncbi:ComEA family DNA-binding protein [Glaciihabitans sp. dw_435]|uniref:ComEA family DNA-binding protein n=1 Tax=Glaciihabitans sp. dw_435 TaxID=2720081 RepID=UPI0027DDE568|nr:ComEA family DNA-binding protein [Glaciihabitans sp. dw_435]
MAPHRERSDDQNRGRARLRLKLGAAVVVVLAAAGIGVLVTATSPTTHSATVTRAAPQVAASASASAKPGAIATSSATTVFVHILGEVARPGLYELHQGDRAIDAVAAAGGLTSRADQTQLNLARFITDGEQIIVPRVGATPAAPPSAGGGGAVAGAKININTADASALESLTGVGPALAGRIVDWRQANGPFASVDDLLNVTGIGQKTLDGFRDEVTT